MHVLMILIPLLQVFFAVHAYRRGYEFTWIFIILMFPLLGILVYLAIDMGPTFSYRISKFFKKKLAPRVDPHQELVKLKEEIRKIPTLEKRQRLAMLYFELGLYDEALSLLEQLLNKPFEDDPILLLDKAEILFALKDYDQAKEVLHRLMADNPRGLCTRVENLYEKTLRALGQTVTH